jgi:D-galactarolactone cycloisomerase
MDRRAFLKTSSIALGATMIKPFSVLSHHTSLIADAVIIKSVELLYWDKKHFVVVTDQDGVKGITFCNTRIEHLYGIFKGLVVPNFVDKDARQIETLVDEVYKDERNYKYSGMPFWNCVGHVEVAIWDLLGKKSQKPVHALLGKKLRSEIPMYLSSLTRDNTAEEELEKIKERLAISGCKAVKIKVGGRMGTNATAEERGDKIVKGLRKHSDKLTIYADANGSFNVDQGIRMAKFLEEHGVDIFEEPCQWEDFESNKRVADAVSKMKLAGGEQDTSFYRFEWYCKNNGLDVLQPDTFYNGGIIRTLAIGKLAEKYQKGFAPHSPKADPLEAPFLHLAAVTPILYGYQEFPITAIGKKSPDWFAPHFQLANGALKVSDDPGLGITYDDSIWKQAKLIE